MKERGHVQPDTRWLLKLNVTQNTSRSEQRFLDQKLCNVNVFTHSPASKIIIFGPKWNPVKVFGKIIFSLTSGRNG